ncbi:TonB-dependent receptor [Rubrivivax benzoatilyticus]|uniref:TonB-dependent receptor n=1 Tax=Rubrivivax benzoatilyticus TaxID=316997 RepID=A0ABX0HYS8_9BURK|nr:TonB-dependent receptor [Rubrivivax benzoatilyticus]EGJ11571.1 TonB-dependent siderophore receptor family protein 21 [Rubrivivax benzoatilyticus JA2 = ATCC BAA-35]NHK99580.1 TonB-dependent receptor [Rubrivivax benzoatilyticus]NHL25454.1 TonB-dependent receptor [Rubrivivax benzoatilyticus]
MRRARFTPAPLALAAAAVVLNLATSVPVHAQTGATAAAPLALELPAQPLGQALNELARRADLQLSFPADAVAGRTAPAVSGRLTPEQALQRLLAGSGLAADIDGRRVVVKPADAVRESALPAVKASAGALAGDLPAPHAGGQVARGARVGALGNLSVMDTPFSTIAYTAELIAQQQARTVAEVLGNDPATRFTTSAGHAYENFRVRGFDVNAGDLAIEGMYGLAPVGHSPVEALERVELLKGPSALFSGMPPGGGVGGVVNLVPKRAGDEPLTRASFGLQSDSQAELALDLGRRFGEHKQWGLRVNTAYADGDTTLDEQSKKREFLSAALDFRGEALTATLDAYTSTEKFDGGTPAMYWFATTDIPGAPDPSTNQFRNGWGELKSQAVIARAEYTIHEQLDAFAGVGRREHDYAGFINGTHARQIAANGDYSGRMVGQRGYSDTVSAEAGLRGRFATAGVRHELVLHATRLDQEDGSAVNMASFSSNIYRPITPTMVAVPGTAPKTGETTLDSLALVDTLSFLDDRLRLTLGARHQGVETRSFNPAGAVTAHYDKSALTPAVAVVAKPWGQDVSLYANYVQGLSKGDTVSAALNGGKELVFAPYKTEQKELGVKWTTGRFTNTVSLFEIGKPVLVTTGDPLAPTYSDDGEKRVRGVEWSTFGEPMAGVRVLGGISYNQGKLTRTAFGQNDGHDAVGTPRWQGNLGAEWDTPWLQGLTLSTRLTATGEQYLDQANTQRIPGWSQIDVGARYATELMGRPTQWRLGVNNLFDRHYYAGSFSDSTPIATLGAKRSVAASVTVDF